MGYYTRHKLEIIVGNNDIDHETEISKITDYEYGCFDDEIKWYDHEKDMRKYSKLNPNILFKLSGIGEESPDCWIEYHMDGKMQRCKGEIVFPEYDESKLN